MCGIVGWLELSGGRPDAAVLEAMVAAVRHRGPDGARVDLAGRMGLGHARLRVIDLSEAADQPMWNETRSVGVVFNGEIYNFRALRDELVSRGVRFRTASDTEVILRLYEEKGEEAIERLDGMFALALWDARRRRLVLARDRAGKKPLFYYRDGRRFVFASEIKALHRHPKIAREPNLDALPSYLAYGYFPCPATAYANVRQLPPATVLVVDAHGELRQRRFWSPPFARNGIHDLAAARNALAGLVTRAVEKRLVADVPLGAFLSGGLDSTIVVGVMSRLASRPVRTFSIGFEDAPDFDETHYAEIAARSFGCEHTSFRVRPPDGAFLAELVRNHDGPFGDSSAIPTYVVSRLARRSVTVVLNGDGGDELFAGYHRFVAALASERLPPWLRRAGRGVAAWLPEPGRWNHPLRRAKRFLTVAAAPFEQRFRAWCSFFPDPGEILAAPVAEHETAVAEHFRARLDEAREATPLARLLYLNFCTYLPEDLLVKMDRSTMAHGLEARSPLLDTELVDFAARLPDEAKLRGWTTKVLLREAFAELVPPAILERGKMGFGVPLGAWFRGPLRPTLEAHLGEPGARLFDYVRRDVVAAHLDDHLSGRRDFGHRLFCLLTLEMWLRSL